MWVGRVGEGGKVTKVKAINQFLHKMPDIDYRLLISQSNIREVL